MILHITTPSPTMATNHLSLLQQQQQQLYYHPQTWSCNIKDYCSLSEREHLFEKPLTPSDVGKLNRLVIPKQHAEKYFPLDSESGDKGLILSFEDECGKAWSFRYSYWTSSQSYVLTKGWSRYVKDKRLDAGDIVLFERRRSDADRLYIGWRRNGEASAAAAIGTQNQMLLQCSPATYGAQPPFLPRRCAVQPECVPSSGDTAVPSQQAAASNSKKLRLFGVNMEYGLFPGSPSTDDQQPRELQFLPCYTDLNSQL